MIEQLCCSVKLVDLTELRIASTGSRLREVYKVVETVRRMF